MKGHLSKLSPKKETFRAVELIFPTALVVFHALYITPGQWYDLHWGFYLVLFACFVLSGDVRQVLRELAAEIRKVSFLWKGLVIFAGSILFTAAVYYFSLAEGLFYPVWFIPQRALVIVWAALYVFIQPLVDTIFYEVKVLSLGGMKSKALAIIVISVRTYLETGVLIVDKTSVDSMLALAYFVSAALPVIFYLFTKKASVSYMGEVLYRISVAGVICWFALRL